MSDERISADLHSPQQASAEVKRVLAWCKAMLMAGNRVHLGARKSTRTTEQNSMLWSILTDLSEQVQWPIDGVIGWMTPEEWKDILTAGLKKHQRIAQGIEGGFVILGTRTSRMSIADMVELIELAHAFGAERGVVWGDEARAAA